MGGEKLSAVSNATNHQRWTPSRRCSGRILMNQSRPSAIWTFSLARQGGAGEVNGRRYGESRERRAVHGASPILRQPDGRHYRSCRERCGRRLAIVFYLEIQRYPELVYLAHPASVVLAPPRRSDTPIA